MTNKTKLSVLIVAHNEEKKLKSCLEKLKDADEVILLLDKTNDNSKKIAKDFNIILEEGSWELEGERRNYGLSLCSGDWILEVDADEHVSKELFIEIRKNIEKAEPGYFLIPFDNYIGNRKVKYGWGAS